jgi:hypothetical protein
VKESEMPTLDINFKEVDNEYVVIPPGIYAVEVVKADVMPTKDGMSQKVVVEMKIVDASDIKFVGRGLQDHISVKMQTRLKQLGMCFGLNVEKDGFTTEMLTGRSGRVEVRNETYAVSSGNVDVAGNPVKEMRTASRVKDYLWKS